MTEAQVLAAFQGEARRAEHPADYGDGIVGTEEIPRYEIFRVPFKVVFAFERGRLVMVNLSCSRDPVTVSVDYRSIRDHVAEKYGAPLNEERSSLGPRATWKTQTSIIRLSLFDLTGLLVLAYTPPKTAETDKL